MIQKICLLFILFIGIKNVVAQDRTSNLDLFFKVQLADTIAEFLVANRFNFQEHGDQTAKKIKTDTLNYYLSEDEMNSMGYAFLMNNSAADAEIAFKENTNVTPRCRASMPKLIR